MNDRWTERLSEYVDGDLSDRDRAALEAHLPSCVTCRETIEDLRALVNQARVLEPSEPSVDLWPSIAARIEASSRPVTMRQRPSWMGWRISLSLPQASLAALALVAITASAMWWTVGQAPRLVTRGPSVSGARPLAVGTGPAAPSPAATSPKTSRTTSATSRMASPDDALAAAFADPQYDATIAELQNILDNERSRLDPNTVRVVEKNLRIIDRAVADARRAVVADPSSLYLREHLARVMMQKVSLLRQATQIAGAQG
jgi:anti-sigma factor RsiW